MSTKPPFAIFVHPQLSGTIRADLYILEGPDAEYSSYLRPPVTQQVTGMNGEVCATVSAYPPVAVMEVETPSTVSFVVDTISDAVGAATRYYTESTGDRNESKSA